MHTRFSPHRATRFYALLILLLFLVPLIAACGGTTEPQAASDGPTAAIVTTEADTAPTTAAQADATLPPEAEPTAADGFALGSSPVPEPTPQPGPADTTFPMGLPQQDFGVVVHLYYTDRERALQLAQNAEFGWVRQQVVWRDIEDPGDINDPNDDIYGWDELDAIVDATNAYGRKLLVNVVQSPTAYNATNGLPDDPKRLGDFLEKMAMRYGNKIAAYEVWNEPNLAVENGGEIVPEDVGHYVEILMEAYTRIKAVSPSAFVLAAASSSTGVTNPAIALSDEDFYRAMYSYKDGIVGNYFDIQAVHPGGSANPPDTLWPDNPSTADGWTDDTTFYFRHVENVRSWMEEYSMDNHQVWITEYGWATENDTPGYEFGNQVSFEQQADYVAGAMQRTYDEYPWVSNMFLWNLNFAVLWGEQNEPLHEQASFGILNPDWSPRPSYLAAQSTIAQLKAEQQTR